MIAKQQMAVDTSGFPLKRLNYFRVATKPESGKTGNAGKNCQCCTWRDWKLLILPKPLSVPAKEIKQYTTSRLCMTQICKAGIVSAGTTRQNLTYETRNTANAWRRLRCCSLQVPAASTTAVHRSPDGGGSRHLCNVCKVVQSTRRNNPEDSRSSYSPPWEPEISP
jgi:hypothetical protein